MSNDSGWFGQIEREWAQLKQAHPSLDVEKFFRHVVSAHKVGFLAPESLAAIANALLTSTLKGAPYLGRRLLERVGVNRHPTLRVALALSLLTGTGGEADLETGHAILEDVMRDDTAEGPLRGMAAAALADSARLGRDRAVDVALAKSLYENAVDLGHKASAFNLGLYWEGAWGAGSGDVQPDTVRAVQMYRKGGTDARCQARISALRESAPA